MYICVIVAVYAYLSNRSLTDIQWTTRLVDVAKVDIYSSITVQLQTFGSLCTEV